MTAGDVRRRIFSVVESGSVQMSALLRLIGIKVTDDDVKVPSAAVSCGAVPEMIVNISFVEKHCRTDEHLLMLIMHELYHVILGHTTFFERRTAADNIAFDAVINSMLCRSFPQDKFTSFFTSLNSSSDFPSCLLRPADDCVPDEFKGILKILYETDCGTYYEVYRMLKDKVGSAGNAVLIGNHRGDSQVSDPSIRRAIDEIIGRWPRNVIVGGRDMGGAMRDMEIELRKEDAAFKRKLVSLMFESGCNDDSDNPIDMRCHALDSVEARTFFPKSSDRLAIAKRMIYGRLCSYDSTFDRFALRHDNDVRTLVYLDVSGSVTCALPKFVSAIVPAFRKGLCEMYAFSTEVCKVGIGDLARGRYKSTGGTDGNCVFEHYYSLPASKRKRRLLLITDGEIGEVSYADRLRRDGVGVNVALIGSCRSEYVAKFAKRIECFDISA